MLAAISAHAIAAPPAIAHLERRSIFRYRGLAMKKLLTSVVLIACCMAAPPAIGQGAANDVTDMQALRQAVKNDKRALVESLMKLDAAEAKRFWPIYDSYQRSLDQTSRRRVVELQELMFRDKALTNASAKHYVNELLAIDDAEIKDRKAMRNRVMRALPPTKAARYMQLEEKIRAVADYDEASVVPLAR
jgi:hypothetical protein